VSRRVAALIAVAACLPILVASGCGDEAPRPATAGSTLADFPTRSSVGVPKGWKPAQTRSTDLVVTQNGAVVKDILFTGGDLIVKASNVTVKRIKMQGGSISNWAGPECENGLLVEDSAFEPPPGQRFSRDSEGVIGVGGYTARRVKIWRRGEGFRVGGRSAGCKSVRIEDSFAKISVPPDCPGDPHSDGIQGVDGPPLTIVNVTIDFREAACGTAPFFVPDEQGNTTATVDRLLVMGGGTTFRLGVPGSVSGLRIADGTWDDYPVDVKCELLSGWDARLVEITRRYRVVRSLHPQRCQ
jgi:hypothetical protein